MPASFSYDVKGLYRQLQRAEQSSFQLVLGRRYQNDSFLIGIDTKDTKELDSHLPDCYYPEDAEIPNRFFPYWYLARRHSGVEVSPFFPIPLGNFRLPSHHYRNESFHIVAGHFLFYFQISKHHALSIFIMWSKEENYQTYVFMHFGMHCLVIYFYSPSLDMKPPTSTLNNIRQV